MGTITRMEPRKVADLHPYEYNAKLHPPEQIEKLRASFREFGMIVPIGIDSQDRVIYGHGRLMAAQAEGWETVPTITIGDLSEEQRQAFIHADNLLGETGYDKEILKSEMLALQAAGFDVTLVGFEAAGIRIQSTEEQLAEMAEAEDVEAVPAEPRTKRGQRWQLGDHVLMCGDSTNAEEMRKLVSSTPPPQFGIYGPAVRGRDRRQEQGPLRGRIRRRYYGEHHRGHAAA